MDHSILAAENFLSGCNCAQSIVVAFSDVTGMDREYAARLSCSFGGGMGRMREVCGAVSGILMVIGLLYGYSDPGPGDCNKLAHYTLVQDMAGKFRREIGTILCREILDNPPSDPAPTPRTEEYYKTRPCTRVIMTAARILDQYIAEHPLPEKS